MLRNTHRRLMRWGLLIAFVAVVVAGYTATMLLLPVPRPSLEMRITSGTIDTGQATSLPWPATGSAAVGADGYGLLAAQDADQPRPTASMAKIIMALAVLHAKPLQAGQPGPLIPITQQDEAYYHAELARGGSTVPVATGQQLTQYQALQALLISSGNNIADTLADWAFGSRAEALQYIHGMLKDMGLTKTQLADLSGYSPLTISTAREMTQLGLAFTKQPVLAEIVSQESIVLPTAGPITNTNLVLGQANIHGIKTGYTPAAGGCLLFSATKTIEGTPITIVGVTMGLPDKSFAFEAAPKLVDAAYSNFVQATIATKGQVFGVVTTPWAAPVEVIADQHLQTVVWKGTPLKRQVSGQVARHGSIGTVRAGSLSTNLTLQTGITAPDGWWRLTHPIDILTAK